MSAAVTVGGNSLILNYVSFYLLDKGSIHWKSIHQYYMFGLSRLWFVQGVYSLVYCIQRRQLCLGSCLFVR